HLHHRRLPAGLLRRRHPHPLADLHRQRHLHHPRLPAGLLPRRPPPRPAGPPPPPAPPGRPAPPMPPAPPGRVGGRTAPPGTETWPRPGSPAGPPGARGKLPARAAPAPEPQRDEFICARFALVLLYRLTWRWGYRPPPPGGARP